MLFNAVFRNGIGHQRKFISQSIAILAGKGDLHLISYAAWNTDILRARRGVFTVLLISLLRGVQCVDFFTIDTAEVYQLVKDQLITGRTYPIHIGQKIIGQAELLTFTYDTP